MPGDRTNIHCHIVHDHVKSRQLFSTFLFCLIAENGFMPHAKQLFLALVLQIGRGKSSEKPLGMFSLMSDVTNVRSLKSSSAFIKNDILVFRILKQPLILGSISFYSLFVWLLRLALCI